MFDQDCAIDFDEKPYLVNLTTLTVHKKNISIRGKLKEQTLRMIYNRLLRSMPLSPIEMNDVHDSFNKAGITDLKRPKRSTKTK